MRRGLLGGTLALGLASIGSGSVAHASEFVAKVRPGVAFTLEQTPGIKVLEVHAEGSLILVDVDPKHEGVLLTKLYGTQGVEYAVPNFRFHRLTQEGSSQVTLRDQWAISKVNALHAWATAGHRGKKDIIVAVIDTGVDYKHESLASNMIPGYDFNENDADPMDVTSFDNPGHGTHCAGIIAANGTVNQGTVGIAPGISVMPVRFLDEHGGGDLMNGIKAIDYAIQNKANVISASWGAGVSESEARPIIEAVKRASDANVIFVSAASNDGQNNDQVSMYPANARFANTITVAASDSTDAKPYWSNYGRAKVDLAAPGDKIISTLPANTYGELSGTSMATPLVAGSVALLLSEDSSLTGQQVRSILQTTGAKVQIETACNCRIDVGAAMDAIVDKTMTVVPAAATVAPNETQAFGAVYGRGRLRFESTNPEVAEISEDGILTAKAVGETTVVVTDSSGNEARSLPIYVAEPLKAPPAPQPQDPGQEPEDPYNPGHPGQPGDGKCPFPDEATCKVACDYLPSLPWCPAGHAVPDLEATIAMWSKIKL